MCSEAVLELISTFTSYFYTRNPLKPSDLPVWASIIAAITATGLLRNRNRQALVPQVPPLRLQQVQFVASKYNPTGFRGQDLQGQWQWVPAAPRPPTTTTGMHTPQNPKWPVVDRTVNCYDLCRWVPCGVRARGYR
jgi:hypothetical protein